MGSSFSGLMELYKREAKPIQDSGNIELRDTGLYLFTYTVACLLLVAFTFRWVSNTCTLCMHVMDSTRQCAN